MFYFSHNMNMKKTLEERLQVAVAVAMVRR